MQKYYSTKKLVFFYVVRKHRTFSVLKRKPPLDFGKRKAILDSRFVLIVAQRSTRRRIPKGHQHLCTYLCFGFHFFTTFTTIHCTNFSPQSPEVIVISGFDLLPDDGFTFFCATKILVFLSIFLIFDV